MTFVSILYVILAVLGLSFLIFIHELGHYFMARRVGMRVETFSIGFGTPIYKWVRDGVNWQIGWLLFGGYVKIAGMEMTDQTNIYEIKEGFFSKKPWDRIKVALMGPVVNIVFALLVFCILSIIGGRVKGFNEYTHKIGWIDPQSELFIKGVRPGDEITSYNDQAFSTVKEHFIAPMMTSDDKIRVQGFHFDALTGQKKPFDYTVKTYGHPKLMGRKVSGVLASASYLIYDRLPNGEENPLISVSPMNASGIEYGDRIVWVDGETIHSVNQLNHVLNDSKSLLTVIRKGQIELVRVPRVKIAELKFEGEFKDELMDWQFEAKLNSTPIQELYTIPYNLTNKCVVEGPIKFIDQDKESEFFPKHILTAAEKPLEVGDKIIAVDGVAVTYSYQILEHLQNKFVHIVVQKDLNKEILSWKQADHAFDQQVNSQDLNALVSQIGTGKKTSSFHGLVLLNPVTPQKRALLTESDLANKTEEKIEQQKQLNSIEDPVKRAQATKLLQDWDNQLLLGINLQDKQVNYNPNPFELFKSVSAEIWFTLKSLFTGSLSPKWMSGPLGIVQVVHDQSMGSLRESLFWLGAISLNLGLLNLLPLPVLDGGTICFSLYELITGKRLKAKTLERLIVPFAVFLIGLFIFITYHDLIRIFTSFTK